MEYGQDFLPNNGDRVSFVAYSDTVEIGRVVGFNSDMLSVKNSRRTVHLKWTDVIYLRSCPWYLWWQKRR